MSSAISSGTAPGPARILPRLARDLYLGVSFAFLLLRLFQVPPWDQSVDAFAYWTTRGGDHYGSAAGSMGAYLYSPAFSQLLAPITWLPWNIFVTAWTALNLAVLWGLLGRWSIVSLLFLPIPFEIISGNVHLLYAAMIVIGFRFAPAWVLAVITKLTPAIGVLWFAARREWSQLLLAGAATAVVVAVSFVIDRSGWASWIGILDSSGAALVTPGWYLPIPLIPRLVVAAAVVVAAALTDRRWLLPVAVVIAQPIVWLNSLAILAACVPLMRQARDARLSVPA